MLRSLLCVALAFFLVGTVRADDQNTKKDQKKATITKVDPQKQTITVRMKNDEGKDVDKTFTLTEDVRMFDDTGKVVAIDFFQSGNDVLVIEREGKLVELKKDRLNKNGENKESTTDKSKQQSTTKEKR